MINRRAFTLLELIVVLVILAVLASLAIPTFGRVIGRSQDETTKTTLSAMARDARALNAFGDTTLEVASQDAARETTASYALRTTAATAYIPVKATREPTSSEMVYSTTTSSAVLSILSPSTRVCVITLSASRVGTPSCVAPTPTGSANAVANGQALSDGTLLPLDAPAPTAPPAVTYGPYETAVRADSPSQYTQFDDALGATVVKGAIGYDGVYGAATTANSSPAGLTGSGKALNLTYTTANIPYLVAGAPAGTPSTSTPSGPFTLEVLYRTASSPASSNIVERYGSGSGGGYALRTNGSSFIVYSLNDSAGSIGGTINSPGLVGNRTYHLALRVEPTNNNTKVNMTLFVDGVSAGTITSASWSAPRGSNPLRIGTYGDANFSLARSGSVDELAVYPQLLSNARITAHSSALTR